MTSMEFVFVNVQKPSDALQLAKAPEVRSHVTRYQWKQSARRDKRTRRILLGVAQDVNGAGFQNGLRLDSFKPEPPSILPQIGGLRVDPFQSYPISGQPWTPLLVDHYLIHMAVDIPELDLPGNHGLLRTTWFPLVMTEPALFSVILLLAASHYASLQVDPSSMKIDLLGFRYTAVLSINRSLDARQPENVHDALIGAIAKMASYEAMFGSLENYNIHMQGLARLISLRGGLTSLGLNGLLQRMVIWIDCNAAFLHGSAMYFLMDTSVPGESPPYPNPGQFLGSS
ncbi:transcriptional regulator family: Fungal Specific TF [Penicillium roqueforti]|uniref:Uncharacterized protein n=1 Tax=Penicillium roqueforti (strain FM164) TaxID=1365484 RepID=W6QN64_PENRF|nr:transcriptional regulator family: Fungal Specific TF [Penicillium roqueforti]CDM35594.1 Protein of unknown function DUF3468 [Penicillium roqueforti FM164]KAI2692018.1 transcriptional regulator family: Fungal Specific TF [Penicillium roqueforti]KAI2698742.1 transcriptional regulator family: Fungal Specific TF [Penicillium roqueforti]KAI2740568.1 transcriptional regulator family: Fungal Specific TF [Penicillium roqueforti]